jgi:hypothetical protein
MLRWHWGEAYIICHPEPDVWIAARKDTRETLRDTTPLGLRDQIIADYFARPVGRPQAPREDPPGCCGNPVGSGLGLDDRQAKRLVVLGRVFPCDSTRSCYLPARTEGASNG